MTTRLRDGSIHLARVIFEDSQFHNSSRQHLGVFCRVVAFDTKQDEDTRTYS